MLHHTDFAPAAQGLTERSKKFYDGTYEFDADGFRDSKGQYHIWGESDDPETWAPTPPLVMSLDVSEDELTLQGAMDSDVPDDVDIGAPRLSLDQTMSNAQRDRLSKQEDSGNFSPTSHNSETSLSTRRPGSSSMSSGLNPAPWSRLHIREDIFQVFSGKGQSSDEAVNDTSIGEAKPQQELFAGLPDQDRLTARLEGICVGTKLGSESEDIGLKDCYDWCGVRHDSIVAMVDGATKVVREPPLAGSSDPIKLSIPADQELDTKQDMEDGMNVSAKGSELMITSGQREKGMSKARKMIKPNKKEAIGDDNESRHPKKQTLQNGMLNYILLS